ncbi:MAG: O-antigen translocase [Desulfuromonadales bacterium]|nr:O-antigen translocase [Desulfuromonadales bacterium]
MDVANIAKPESGSYRSILKSTSLIGGASVLNILIGMVRIKFVAVLLGPTGVGLLGMYAQITALITTITGMGISSSGVRQVAEAVGSGDDERVARTVITLRRTAGLTGGLGLLVMVVFAVPLARLTFGNTDYAWTIAVLGITLLAGAIAAGQGCIINGTRRIGDLARISVIGALNGTLISIPCFYLWGEAGIVPSLILSSMAALATSWWFARRVPVKAITLPWRDSTGEARQLLSLGISFMGAGLALTLSNYLIRVVMLRQFDLADVGIYQAAFSLSGILVGFVLGAMGADYYPRLTAVANDNASVHRMVNEQSQISILLALPGLAAMMIFAPLIIEIFYAATFETAVPILRWCILGILGRVYAWPLSYVLVAKGTGRLFLILETFFAFLHLGMVFLFIQLWGLPGAGVAFLVLYLTYTVAMLCAVHHLTTGSWNSNTLRLTLYSVIVMVLLMLNCTYVSQFYLAWTVNILFLFGSSYFCFYSLSDRTGITLNSLLAKVGIK